MKKLILIFSLLICTTAHAKGTLQDAVDRAVKVIMIYEEGDKMMVTSGTAWKLYSNYLVTNKHVALGCGSKICLRRLIDSQGRRHEFKVIGVSARHDVAVIESLTPTAGSSPSIELKRPSVGDPVYSVGYPEGKFRVSDKCNITAIGLPWIFSDYESVTTNCYVFGGASGSALYNADGDIVALVYAMGVDEVDGKSILVRNRQYSIPADMFVPEIKFILENPSVIEGQAYYGLHKAS